MKSKDELLKEFMFVTPLVEGKTGARCDNLHRFSQQLSFIDAAVCGGKMSHKEASRRVKDLYKSWKSANKSLGDSLK